MHRSQLSTSQGFISTSPSLLLFRRDRIFLDVTHSWLPSLKSYWEHPCQYISTRPTIAGEKKNGKVSGGVLSPEELDSRSHCRLLFNSTDDKIDEEKKVTVAQWKRKRRNKSRPNIRNLIASRRLNLPRTSIHSSTTEWKRGENPQSGREWGKQRFVTHT